MREQDSFAGVAAVHSVAVRLMSWVWKQNRPGAKHKRATHMRRKAEGSSGFIANAICRTRGGTATCLYVREIQGVTNCLNRDRSCTYIQRRGEAAAGQSCCPSSRR